MGFKNIKIFYYSTYTASQKFGLSEYIFAIVLKTF